MKWVNIIFLIILLNIVVFTCGCLSSSQGLHVKKIDEEPERYVNFNEDRMRRFSFLREAIKKHDTYVDVPEPLCNEINGILRYFDIEYILYNNTYYEVLVWHAD